VLKVFLLIVVGLAGDPEHGKTFHAWGNSLAEASTRLGVPSERLTYLVDAPAEVREEINELIHALDGREVAED